MVQEFCGSHPDMFQTPPSPVTSSRGGGGGGPVLGGGHSSLQQTSALASSAMASTYGYHPFHAAYHQQGGYSDYYHQLQGPPPSSSGASEVQLSGLTPLVPGGGGGGGGGGNGSASPGPWSTGCTYPTSISPRSGTAGAGGLQEDSWAAFGSPMVSSMASQLGQPMQGSYYGQTHPHSRATPNAFDPMGLGQYGTTAASQSPASVGGMHGLHGGAGGGGGPQQSHSPDQPTSVIQSTGGAGMPGARHARPPYDWMKKQTTYQSAPSNDDPTSPKSKTRTKDKYRIVYSEYQKVELEKEYLYSKYITIQRKAELSRAIQLSERQVKIWFQNRRAKERKQKRKREDIQMSANSSSEVHSPDDSNDPDQHQHDVMKMEMDSPHHAPPPQQHQTQHPSHQPQQHHIVDGHHLVKAEMMQQPPSMHPSEYNAPPNPHSQIIVPH